MTCLWPFGTTSMRFLVPNLRGSVLLEMPFSFHLSDWACPVFMSASLDMSNFSFGKCDMSNFWVGKCDMSNFALCKIGHVTFLRFLQKLSVFEKTEVPGHRRFSILKTWTCPIFGLETWTCPVFTLAAQRAPMYVVHDLIFNNQ